MSVLIPDYADRADPDQVEARQLIVRCAVRLRRLGYIGLCLELCQRFGIKIHEVELMLTLES